MNLLSELVLVKYTWLLVNRGHSAKQPICFTFFLFSFFFSTPFLESRGNFQAKGIFAECFVVYAIPSFLRYCKKMCLAGADIKSKGKNVKKRSGN